MRGKHVIAGVVMTLMVWTQMMWPLAVYAETVLDSGATMASGGFSEGSSSNEGTAASDTLGEAGAKDGSGIENQGQEGAGGSDEDTLSDSDVSQDAGLSGVDSQGGVADEQNSAEGSAGARQVPTAEDGSSVDVYSNGGFVENSFRYEAGELREDAEAETDADGGITFYSSTVPDGATGWGIDVSAHNGTIDWAKVKEEGVDFAILRLGYGTAGGDAQFVANVKGCKKYGIPFGVYIYSYGWDAGTATSEAKWAISVLFRAGVKPSDLSLPVFFDLENEFRDSSNPNNPNNGKPAGVDDSGKYHIIGGPSTLASMAKAFCSTVAAAGYQPGVYANLNWWNNYLTDSSFGQWDRWVAQYNDTCDYKGEYSLWQYSSKGQVDGIRGNVDVNYAFGNFSDQLKYDAADALAAAHAADLPDGTYTVASAIGGGTVLDAEASGTANGTRVQFWEPNRTDAQVWRVTHDAAGYVTLANASNGLVLDLFSSSTADRSALNLWEPNGSRAQRWVAVKLADGTFELRSALDPDKAVDAPESSTAKGSRPWLYSSNGTRAQRWSFSKALRRPE